MSSLMGVLGPDFRSFARAVCALNHQAISLVPVFFKPIFIYYFIFVLCMGMGVRGQLVGISSLSTI